LLNVPPDRRGLIHENDINSLTGFRRLLDEELKTNLAAGAKAKASSYRGNDRQYSPRNLFDNNPETYWTTNDNETTPAVEIDLKPDKPVKYIVLQEYIKLGQRVKSFSVEALIDNSWQTVGAGTTIGYKRIIKIDPVKTNKIKVVISGSKACPVISAIEIY
jgi:alpha-L-fucosidase